MEIREVLAKVKKTAADLLLSFMPGERPQYARQPGAGHKRAQKRLETQKGLTDALYANTPAGPGITRRQRRHIERQAVKAASRQKTAHFSNPRPRRGSVKKRA